ncbi:MAG: hemerythrin domain-containing protein [Segetibacter sp.]
MLEEVVLLFEGHAHAEDTLVFPMLNEVAPKLVTEFEKQHIQDHQLGEELETAIDQLKAAGSRVEKMKAGIQIQLAFTEFVAFNLSHMNQEETIINEKLWAHYSDDELMAIQQKVVATVSPEKNAKYGYWMLKGLSQNEIIGWYREIKENAPPFVLAQMLKLAKSVLPQDKYRVLSESFEERVFA